MFKSKKKISKLSEAEISIEKQHAEILRKQKELRERLIKLPAEMAARRAQEERAVRERAGSVKTVSRIGSTRQAYRPRGRTPSKQAYVDKLQFFALLIVFVVAAILLWSAIGK